MRDGMCLFGSASFVAVYTDSILKRLSTQDDVMACKTFPHYWPFVRGIHRWPVDCPHKGPVMWNFDFFFMYVKNTSRTNSRVVDDFRRHDALVTSSFNPFKCILCSKTYVYWFKCHWIFSKWPVHNSHRCIRQRLCILKVANHKM